MKTKYFFSNINCFKGPRNNLVDRKVIEYICATNSLKRRIEGDRARAHFQASKLCPEYICAHYFHVNSIDTFAK